MTKEERLFLERTIHQALEDKDHSLSITITKEGTTVSVYPRPTEDASDPVVEGPYKKLEKAYDDAIKSLSVPKSCETCVHWGAMDDVCRTCYDFDEWEGKKNPVTKACYTCKHGLSESYNMVPRVCLNCINYNHWEEEE